MTAKPVEAAFESAANLAILRNAANREPDKHQYYGGCVWCRIDNAEFLGGGAHEHALRLLDLLDAKDRELAEAQAQTRMNRGAATAFAEAVDERDAQLVQLQAKLDRVRALHFDRPRRKVDTDAMEEIGCAACGHRWPCPTIRAIDGES